MALVPAVLSLNWVSNYIGPHRVCYRIVGAPTFTCTVPGSPGPGFHPNCAGNGAPCSYDIDILVDNETCDVVTYEIYVQPACEDEVSVVGRITLAPALSFIPDPACNRYTVTCDSSGISGIPVLAAGAGYTAGTFAVPVTGDGVGATADATVTPLGDVLTYTADGLGAGYPTDAAYPNTNMSNLVVAGSPAGLEMNLTIAGGTVTVNSIDAGGVLYQVGDTVIPNTGITGVPATNEVVTVASVTATGSVTGITVTAPGSTYTFATADLTGLAGGAGAVANNATLLGCGALTVYDCTGITGTTLPSSTLQPGETYEMCGPNTPTVPTEYSVVENGNCLCNCIEQDIQETGAAGTIDYTYIDCNGAVVTNQLTASQATGNVCMVDGSLTTVVAGGAVETIVVVGPCDAA